MPRFFINERGGYYETLTDIEARPGHTSVPQRPAPHWEWTDGKWVEGERPAPPKRPLSRWSFMQILDEQGLISTIQARIDAMPAGDQKRRAQGKFKNQTVFHHDAPEMRALKTMMEAADPEFDFDALWAAGEALEYET